MQKIIEKRFPINLVVLNEKNLNLRPKLVSVTNTNVLAPNISAK